MEHKCVSNMCYNCVDIYGPCLCDKCECGRYYHCYDCVQKFLGDDGLKPAEQYCVKCNIMATDWYTEIDK